MTRTAWDVTVTLDVALPTEDVLAEIVDALPAGGSAGRSAWSDRLTVNVELYTTSPARAGDLAAELAEHAVHAAAIERADGDAARVLSIEVLTPEETERRSATANPMDALISVPDAAPLLGLTPAAVRARAEKGAFDARKIGDSWVLRRALVERDAASRERTS